MAGFDAFRPELPPVPLLPPLEISIFEVPPEVWPHPKAPEPDLSKRGWTEAKCVHDYFYGRTADERLDALKHLTNIAMLKARVAFAYWSPKPFLKFVDARTSRKDWENCDPHQPILQKLATRNWLLLALPELIDRYSPKHITRRELLELARMRDADLLHIAHAAVCDLLNESAKQALHEIHFSRLWEFKGQAFYFDQETHSAVQASTVAAPKPDYASAIQMLVRDKRLRAALPKQTCRTLELVFRRLDSGTDAKDVIASVAVDLNRDERTVRRHLATARQTAADLNSDSGLLMRALGDFVVPDDAREFATATPPHPGHCVKPDPSEGNA